jgi:hypothetical protein
MHQQQAQPQQRTEFFGAITNLFRGSQPEEVQDQSKIFSAPANLNAEREKLLRKKEKAKYRQEVDTNVFLINMGCLKDSSELATGDPVFCKSC